MIPVLGDQIDEADLAACSVLILPNANCLSDKIVGVIRNFKGRLILAGDENGLNDEDYRQRAEIPFEGEAIPLPPHQIVKIGFKTELRFRPDGWDKLIQEKISFSMHPAAHPVIKMDHDGKVAAILISAPCDVPEGTITIPASMRKSGYEIVTLDGNRMASFEGEAIHLPAFEGMLALIS